MKPVLALCLLGTSLSVHAATLSVNYQPAVPNSTAGTAYTFPTGANTDWGYFHYAGDPTASGGTTSMSAVNSSVISGTRNFVVTALNGGYLRGPGDTGSGAPLSYFNYTNGDYPTSPEVAVDSRPSGIFNSQLGTSGVSAGSGAGAGIRMSLTGFTTQSQIQIWTYGFQSTGIFQVFVNGSTTSSYTSPNVTVTNIGSPIAGKVAQLFTLDFTPDSTASSIEITYRMTGSTNGASHVGIQAVSIMPIPEPAAVSLLGLAGVLGFIRRRR